MTTFTSGAISMAVTEAGSGDVDLIWAHGWGQTHRSLTAIAQGLPHYRHFLLDLPGFGESSVPTNAWATDDYADFVIDWMAQLPPRDRVWVGHSFGCRIGVRIASRRPELLRGLVLIAAVGIRPAMPLAGRLRRNMVRHVFSLLKRLAPSEDAKERLRQRWGSADYRNAGIMRPTLVRVLQDDLTASASRIIAPVRLIYGADDVETPLSVARKFESLIPQSELTILPAYGHLDVLTAGRFQLQVLIKEFVGELFSK